MSGRTSTLDIEWTWIFGRQFYYTMNAPISQQQNKRKVGWEFLTPVLNCYYYFLFNSLAHLSSSFSILRILSMTSLSLSLPLLAIANTSFILLFSALTQTSHCLSNSCVFIFFSSPFFFPFYTYIISRKREKSIPFWTFLEQNKVKFSLDKVTTK